MAADHTGLTWGMGENQFDIPRVGEGFAFDIFMIIKHSSTSKGRLILAGLSLLLISISSQVECQTAEGIQSQAVLLSPQLIVHDGTPYLISSSEYAPSLKRRDGTQVRIQDADQISYASGRLIVINDIPFAIVNGQIQALEMGGDPVSFKNRKVSHLSDHFMIIDGIPYLRGEGSVLQPVLRGDVPAKFSPEFQITYASENLLVVNNIPLAIINGRLEPVEIQSGLSRSYGESPKSSSKKISHVSDNLLVIENRVYFRSPQGKVFQPISTSSGHFTIPVGQVIRHASDTLLIVDQMAWAIENGRIQPIRILDSNEPLSLRDANVTFLSEKFMVLNGQALVRDGVRHFRRVVNSMGNPLSLAGRKIHFANESMIAMGDSVFSIRNGRLQSLRSDDGSFSLAGKSVRSLPSWTRSLSLGVCSWF